MDALTDALGAAAAPLFGLVFVAGLLVAAASGPLARRLEGARRRPATRAGPRTGGLRERLSPLIVVQALAASAGSLAGWWATGLAGMALLVGGLGVLLPPFVAAPGRRRRQTQEAMAWSLWCRQLAELAHSGSGLSQSIQGSLDHAPELAAPVLAKVASEAELHGLDAAIAMLEDSGNVWEPEVAAGLRMAATSGGAVAGPLLDLSGRIDEEVDMHRSRTEAVVQLWAQTIALLALAGGVIALMYRNNPSYFDPYATSTGQMVLVCIAGLLLISVSFLVYHSVVREQRSVLVPSRRRRDSKALM